MRKLSKKQIIIIIVVAITIIALAITGVMFGIHNGKNKETVKEDDKIEFVEDDKTDEEQEKKDTEKDATSVVEDESEENSSQSEVQTPEVEEPEQQTTQQQGSSNTNNNNNNNNSGGGTTTPSTPATTPTPTPEPEKSPDAGMYHAKDAFAMERLDKCANILKGGLVGDARYEYNMVDYFDGHIAISASNTSGAWMYITIGYWDTNGANNTDEMKAVFNEIPVLMKQCFEALAPEGGTDLYNTINSLIHQYGGPRKVPTQGVIQESIPGLYVDVNQGKNGLELRFFAE